MLSLAALSCRPPAARCHCTVKPTSFCRRHYAVTDPVTPSGIPRPGPVAFYVHPALVRLSVCSALRKPGGHDIFIVLDRGRKSSGYAGHSDDYTKSTIRRRCPSN